MLDRVRSAAGEPRRAEVSSRNNFPTASGLASSASGFAALAGAASKAARLPVEPGRLSELARSGSGSACRSIFGGFVVWEAGERADGTDCQARAFADEHHWPELVDLAVLLEDAPTKTIRSSEAMQSTVATSPHYWARLRAVPERLAKMRQAILDRDAPTLFPLVMEECDDFRLVCETTTPGLDYLTETSRRVLDAVRSFNGSAAGVRAAYTHDAGAHVHIFTLEEELPALRRAVRPIPGIARMIAVRPGPGARAIPPSRVTRAG